MDTLMHFVHLLGAVAWVGGMIFTSLVAAPVIRQELAAEDRFRVVQRIGRRFRVLEAWAFLFLLASGTYKLTQAGADLLWPPTAFARILFVKLGIVAVLVTLAVLHGNVWGPALAAARAANAPGQAALARRVVTWARVEAGLALGVVGCGALLRMNPF